MKIFEENINYVGSALPTASVETQRRVRTRRRQTLPSRRTRRTCPSTPTSRKADRSDSDEPCALACRILACAERNASSRRTCDSRRCPERTSQAKSQSIRRTNKRETPSRKTTCEHEASTVGQLKDTRHKGSDFVVCEVRRKRVRTATKASKRCVLVCTNAATGAFQRAPCPSCRHQRERSLETAPEQSRSTAMARATDRVRQCRASDEDEICPSGPKCPIRDIINANRFTQHIKTKKKKKHPIKKL